MPAFVQTDRPLRAAILDLDGVVTRTRRLHARAWKQVFDEFLAGWSEQEHEAQAPFDQGADYAHYVDGKPRYDGVRSFLASRGIELPEGRPDDAPGAETVCGLGNRKNARFLALLEQEGVDLYDDAVEQVQRWRQEGMRTAVVTSSRNGTAVLERAGLRPLFDVKIDGADAERLGLRGKPAPDLFVHAARQLGVDPQEALLIEDAVAGVEAGRAGAFGLVVGVDRDGDGALREHGADVVVRDLRDLGPVLADRATGRAPLHARAYLDQITERPCRHRLALFLDYDGTLTPIVRRPEEAVLSNAMRSLLQWLAARATVAIISGRDLDDVRGMVGLDELYYAGSHGFDIAGPGGMRMQQAEALRCLPELDRAEDRLRERLAPATGARVERKRFALAVHYREAAEEDAQRIETVVDEEAAEHPGLRKRTGKKIFELQPDVPWDKGRAVVWLIQELGLAGPEVLPIYVGDDTTDEDAFEALAERGVGIRIGDPHEPTRAGFYLRDTDELKRFLDALLHRLEEIRHHG